MTTQQSNQTAATKLASFVANLTYDELPNNVIHAAVRSLVDTLGAAIGGVGSEEAKMLYAAAPLLGPGKESTLWGTNRRSSAPTAALVNGTVAHVLEMDDFGGCDHSGAIVVPTVLALAEANPAITGRDLIVAIVAGYDIARRPMEALGGYSSHNEEGWHSTGTCGTFGAAAAAGKILGLNVDQLTSAIGLAGSFTGGLWAFIDDGAMSKRYHVGRAAESGATAALLSREGFTGPSRIFEAEWGGFLNTYSREGGSVQTLTEGLGEDFRILKSGIKPYASCRGVHSAIDSLKSLQSEFAFDQADISTITVHIDPFGMGMVGGRQTHSLLSTQMSLPYGLAVTLSQRDASIRQYTEEKRQDSQIRKALELIEMNPTTEMSKDEEPVVEVRLKDGRTMSRRVEVALGAPGNPVSDEDLDAKFTSLASMTLDTDRVASLLALLRRAPEIGNLFELWQLLRVPDTTA